MEQKRQELVVEKPILSEIVVPKKVSKTLVFKKDKQAEIDTETVYEKKALNKEPPSTIVDVSRTQSLEDIDP